MSWLLPFIIPIVVSALTPVATEAAKNIALWLNTKLPHSAVVILASAIAEGANQAQAFISGHSLPPGVGALVAMFVNELGADLGKQPPSPIPPPPA